MKFSTLQETLSTAAHVESLHTMEQSWLMNRISWLLVSQSFCILAYAHLITSPAPNGQLGKKFEILISGLPLFGVLACAFVGLAVMAAQRVISELSNQRALITDEVNKFTGANIPKLGGNSENRTHFISWTIFAGKLPHVLPWLLLVFWACLYVRFEG